jgi:NADPH:quinone reductase-like Zn-dependent oxidoreductase
MGLLVVKPNKTDLARVAEMVESGELRIAIDRAFPLDELPEALRHLGEGRALGKLVIEVGS